MQNIETFLKEGSRWVLRGSLILGGIALLMCLCLTFIFTGMGIVVYMNKVAAMEDTCRVVRDHHPSFDQEYIRWRAHENIRMRIVRVPKALLYGYEESYPFRYEGE